MHPFGRAAARKQLFSIEMQAGPISPHELFVPARLRVVEARQLAEADVDVLRLGDDVAGQNGMLMHPATWRHWTSTESRPHPADDPSGGRAASGSAQASRVSAGSGDTQIFMPVRPCS